MMNFVYTWKFASIFGEALYYLVEHLQLAKYSQACTVVKLLQEKQWNMDLLPDT